MSPSIPPTGPQSFPAADYKNWKMVSLLVRALSWLRAKCDTKEVCRLTGNQQKTNFPHSDYSKYSSIDCTNCDLRGSNFSGVDMTHFKLQGARLSGSNLNGAYYRSNGEQLRVTHDWLVSQGAIFDKDLSNMSFERASLVGNNYTGYNFTATVFKYMVVDSIPLDGAQFQLGHHDGVIFNQTHLRGASFNQSRLCRVRCLQSGLKQAEFVGAQLERCQFHGCDLSDSNFSWARFKGSVDFSESQLDGANFSNATYLVTDERGNPLLKDGKPEFKPVTHDWLVSKGMDQKTRVILDTPVFKPINVAGLSLPNLNRTHLAAPNVHAAGVQLSEADLRHCNFKGGNFYKANLSQAVLDGVDFGNANLDGANCTRAKLPRGKLSGASLEDACLARANLSAATMVDANMKAATLTNAMMKNANLRGADLSQANMSGANLMNADLRGATLTGAKLTGAKLKGVFFDDRTNFEGATIDGLPISNERMREILFSWGCRYIKTPSE